ncbi:MAG TPA: arginine--tRNA ligase, partial [Armatimonadota bacterium]|nr:arginine--tRNA ligase [Armatimonadota bacterium]
MVKQQVRDMLQSALLAAQSDGSLALPEIPEVTLEKPGSREHGDYFTNIAMLLAARERLAPGEVAARIIAHLPSMPEVVKRVEIAGPGFINIYLAPEALHAVLRAIRKQGKAYGRSNAGQGHKAEIEFVSANPNGPLHIGHGRAAVLGDVIARLLEWTGWQVTREYYINDATNSPQMLPLGRALYARYAQLRGREAAQPEEGDAEKYIGEIARKIAEQEGDRYLLIPEAESVAHFAEIALQEMLERQKDELHRFGVDYDIWFSEKSLHQSG